MPAVWYNEISAPSRRKALAKAPSKTKGEPYSSPLLISHLSYSSNSSSVIISVFNHSSNSSSDIISSSSHISNNSFIFITPIPMGEGLCLPPLPVLINIIFFKSWIFVPVIIFTKCVAYKLVETLISSSYI